MTRYVYDLAEGSADMRSLLGGKGANVAEMARIGVRVPDGFTVTTEACVETLRRNATWPEGLWQEIVEHLDALEERTGPAPRRPRPTRCSCRSAPAPCSRCRG